ncbi:MAG TPA: hypothetical protein DCZ94_10500 [Lentisphaeria bacterium]|nr:MAG: hypothetical protein A2X48_06375 [Lentisphaerae bacterium GWF2_49_21]HBC87374.1 hypothetical protein [Lentisphaeria bacterium]
MSGRLIEQPVFKVNFTAWKTSVPKLLDACGLDKVLSQLEKKVLIKPNLVEASPPPITTPVELVSSIIDYIRSKNPSLEIIIGEGCGSIEYETPTPFKQLGYVEMAYKQNVKLVDLNYEKTVSLSKKECRRWPEMHLPEIVMDNFLFSVPVLKAHSMADVTLTMKNMMGAAPPKHYNAGSWKKSAFHERIQEAIFDLNRYRTPDFTLIDATVGMAESHLWGAHCEPPPNLLIASFDPVAVDAYGTQVLGRDWRKIGHIKMSDGVLGHAEAEVVEVK